MNLMSEKPAPVPDVPWPLLLAVTTVIIGSLCLLSANVVYTEGEVMQGLFVFSILLVTACALIGIYRREVAMWCVILLGGSLLLWQAYETRKWAIIHEDIVAIVRYAEDTKTQTGRYPANLDGYRFKNPSVKGHLHRFGTDKEGEFRLSYFMNQPGITYWYSSKTGFGYYPD